MSYPHANVERGLPTQAGSAQKKHKKFSDVLPESVIFLLGMVVKISQNHREPLH